MPAEEYRRSKQARSDFERQAEGFECKSTVESLYRGRLRSIELDVIKINYFVYAYFSFYVTCQFAVTGRGAAG